MAKRGENKKSLILGAVRMIAFAIVFVASVATFAVGFSLGWFNMNSSVQGGAEIGVDIPNVSLAIADCTGIDSPASLPADKWQPYSQDSVPKIDFAGMIPGASRTVALRVINSGNDDELFYSVALGLSEGGETPDSAGNYLGTQIMVTDVMLPGFFAADGTTAAGTNEAKTGGFLVTDTTNIAPLTVAENIVIKKSTTAYVVVTLTFAETGENQNAFMNFKGTCSRYFKLAY